MVLASGPKTFLAQQGVTIPKERASYSNQVALYSRVRGEVRDPGEDSGNTLIFYSDRHRWAWFIPRIQEFTGQQVIQDLIDFFWDYPLAFQMMAHKTHAEDIADCFAGRVYSETASAAIKAMREVLRKKRADSPLSPCSKANG